MTHRMKCLAKRVRSESSGWNTLSWHTGKGSTRGGGGYPMRPPLAISALIFLVPSPTQTKRTHALDALLVSRTQQLASRAAPWKVRYSGMTSLDL